MLKCKMLKCPINNSGIIKIKKKLEKTNLKLSAQSNFKNSIYEKTHKRQKKRRERKKQFSTKVTDYGYRKCFPINCLKHYIKSLIVSLTSDTHKQQKDEKKNPGKIFRFYF